METCSFTNIQYYCDGVNDVRHKRDGRPATYERSIVLHKSEWKRMQDVALDRSYDKQLAEYQEKFQKYLKQGSDALSANWKDNLVTIAKQKMEDMMTRKAKEKHVMTEQEFQELKRKRHELTGEEAEIRDKFLEETEAVLRRNEQGPKMLESALLMSNVIYERDKQREFKESLLEKERRRESLYGEYVKKDAKKYYVEEMEKRNKRLQDYDDYKNMLYQQKVEVEERRKQETKQKKDQEIKDLEEAAREMEQIKIFEESKILKSKKQAHENFLTSLELKKRADERLKKIDETENQIIQKSQECDKKLKAITNIRQKKALANRCQIIEEVAKRTYAITKPDYSNEEISLERAKADREEKFHKQEALKREHKRRMAEEKRKIYEEYLKQQEWEDRKRLEEKKWGILNLQKNREITEELKSRAEKRAIDIMNRNNKDWAEQVKEQQMTREQELEMDRIARRRIDEGFRKEDEYFLRYSAAVLEKCESEGKPLYPLRVAINKYKAVNRIDHKSSIPRHLKSRVPINNKCENKSLF